MSGEIQAVSGVVGDVVATLENLPEPVRRNLFKALGTLITGLVDVPASYLDMKASEFKVRKLGHESVMLAAARNAAEVAGQSPEIGDRALNYYANVLLKSQVNREKVAREAAEASRLSLPAGSGDKFDPKLPEIDEDWLDQFRRLASSKSNADIQLILGRILAGEAHKPGSFSPMTLDIISKLDQSTAKAFETIASYVILIPNQVDLVFSSIIGEDMVTPESLLNEMALRHLQSYGLFVASTGHSINLRYVCTLPPSTLGGETIQFSSLETPEAGGFAFLPPMNGEAWPLSRAGMELLPLLPKSFDRSYARRLRDGMKRLGVALTFPNIDIDVPLPQVATKTVHSE